MNNNRVAAQIILANRYLSLGTAGPDGPWVAPLAYTIEPNGSLVFYSATDSMHAKNIALDSRVAGAIFDSTASSDTADGVQFSGTASVVEDSSLEDVMGRYFLYSFPDPAVRERWMRPKKDFVGDSAQRFYRIVLGSLSKPDPNSTKVDRRLNLDISEIVNALRAETR